MKFVCILSINIAKVNIPNLFGQNKALLGELLSRIEVIFYGSPPLNTWAGFHLGEGGE